MWARLAASEWGAGPRAGQALILGAKAHALLAGRFAVSPADLGPEELRAYLTHLVERRISFSYFNMTVAALRFLYTVTLERDWAVPRLPYQKKARRLPTVLSPEQVAFYHEHGYLHIPAMFTQQETDALSEHLNWLIDTWAIKDQGWTGPWRR